MKIEKRRKTNYIVLLLKLHKYLGLFVFIILFWLAISGIMLNHTTELALADKPLKSHLVSSLYGIPQPEIKQGVNLGNHWLFNVEKTLYLGNVKLSTPDYQPLVGAIQSKELLFVAREKGLLLYTLDGEFIDSLTAPAPVSAIALLNNLVLLKLANGCLSSNESYTELQVCPQIIDVNWQGLNVVPITIKNTFLNAYRGNGIMLEQVILDSHSGRIFGKAGVYFMDAIAILIIILSISGATLWGIRKYRQFQRT